MRHFYIWITIPVLIFLLGCNTDGTSQKVPDKTKPVDKPNPDNPNPDKPKSVEITKENKPISMPSGYQEVKNDKWTTIVPEGRTARAAGIAREEYEEKSYAPVKARKMVAKSEAILPAEPSKSEMPVISDSEGSSDKMLEKEAPGVVGGADVVTVTREKKDVAMPSKVQVVPTSSPIKAGETDDNEKFDYYLEYHGSQANLIPKEYFLDITERYILEVKDKNGKTLPNCDITIVSDKDKVLWDGKTDSNGRLLFFPRTVADSKEAQNFIVSLTYQGKRLNKEFPRAKHGSDTPWKIEMPVDKDRQNVSVEILFLLDTTGSMGDEIAQIQKTLLAITGKIRQMEGSPVIRYGMVLYRDLTDEYVTRRYDFTSDVDQFDKALNEVSAGGGGDEEEAVNMGLFTAVEQMSWSKDSLRLAFLVADAPPHLDYPNDVPYTQTLFQAVRKGIKIYPTAASGLNAKGSYIFRQIAQFTQAKFLFIEYGQNTSGKTHGVQGNYESNNLDDIVVRIVRSELKSYTE